MLLSDVSSQEQGEEQAQDLKLEGRRGLWAACEHRALGQVLLRNTLQFQMGAQNGEVSILGTLVS